MIGDLAGTAIGFVFDHADWFLGLGGGAGLLALIPFAGPVLAFLRVNWTWALPTAIAIGAVIMALWYRGEWKDCQSSVAIDANKAEERLRAQQQADTELRRQLAETLAPIVDALKDQAHDTQIALARVPANPNCRDTPAGRAFDGIVQPARRQTDPGASRPARP